MKKKVYIETTVISDATALPSNDLKLVGRQITTREWFAEARDLYDLYVSAVVVREAQRGDADAAARRMKGLEGIPVLPVVTEAVQLADTLIAKKAVPKEYRDDAMHIAIAAVYGLDYLVSWNFKHITNAHMIPKIKEVCLNEGYKCAEICTPTMV